MVFDLILDSGLTRPDVNKPLLLAGRRLIPDFHWPEQQVVVEADGGAWHDNQIAREDDAERQALLEEHGERVLRVTWSQAITRSGETVARIRAAGVPPLVDRESVYSGYSRTDRLSAGLGGRYCSAGRRAVLLPAGGAGQGVGARYPGPP